ncbi:GTPase [Halanaerobaculum tunisiense]
MTSAILVGQPNVGKTSFVINFAQYLGVEEVELLVRRSAGFVATETYLVDSALEKLTATTSHTTKKLQSIKLNLPVGKQDKELKLVDSCGLLAGIHPEKKTRQAMSQTLQQVFTSQIVLHMIDVSKSDLEHQLPQIDQELYNFLQDKMEYKILANKIDLDTGQQGLNSLYQLVDQRLVLPISALYQSGFAEVKKFLLNQI